MTRGPAQSSSALALQLSSFLSLLLHEATIALLFPSPFRSFVGAWLRLSPPALPQAALHFSPFLSPPFFLRHEATTIALLFSFPVSFVGSYVLGFGFGFGFGVGFGVGFSPPAFPSADEHTASAKRSSRAAPPAGWMRTAARSRVTEESSLTPLSPVPLSSPSSSRLPYRHCRPPLPPLPPLPVLGCPKRLPPSPLVVRTYE